MKQIIYKFFSWIKDHFSLLFTVFFRLHIGGKKKENPEDQLMSNSNEDTEETEHIV